MMTITFPGVKGSKPDSILWNYETGNHGWGNKELQNYTTENARLDGNGGLDIVVEKSAAGYTSSRLTTKGKLDIQPGSYVESSIKAPVGKGVWPAFWMIGSVGSWPACGELDILEGRGAEVQKASCAIHLSAISSPKEARQYGYGYPGGTSRLVNSLDFSYNTFGVYFDSRVVRFFVNRIPTMHVTKEQATKDGNSWPFDKSMFMILNVAIASIGSEGEVFPKVMNVRHIKIWQGLPF